MARKKVMVSVDVDIWQETRRQIEEINATRRKGYHLTLSKVVDKMLTLWNRVDNGKT